jgi:putative sigma-54 modulation protein
MVVTFRGNDIGISDQTKETASKRIEQLQRLLNNVVDTKLEVRRIHNRQTPDGVAAQLTIQTGRQLLRAEERDQDLDKAVNSVLDKMQRQVRRLHEKQSDRRGPRATERDVIPEPVSPFEAEANDATDEGIAIVRRKKFPVKPMDPQEAIEQMELLGHDFFLFHNAIESQINVVYRRRDGSYGLIAPDAI